MTELVDEMYCEHGRTRAACEDCAFDAAKGKPIMREQLHHGDDTQKDLEQTLETTAKARKVRPKAAG
jgi:hypothetical protein